MVKANLNRGMRELGNCTIIKIFGTFLKKFLQPRFGAAKNLKLQASVIKSADIFYLQGTDSIQIK